MARSKILRSGYFRAEITDNTAEAEVDDGPRFFLDINLDDGDFTLCDSCLGDLLDLLTRAQHWIDEREKKPRS
jgi:hypothetical protein